MLAITEVHTVDTRKIRFRNTTALCWNNAIDMDSGAGIVILADNGGKNPRGTGGLTNFFRASGLDD